MYIYIFFNSDGIFNSEKTSTIINNPLYHVAFQYIVKKSSVNIVTRLSY